VAAAPLTERGVHGFGGRDVLVEPVMPRDLLNHEPGELVVAAVELVGDDVDPSAAGPPLPTLRVGVDDPHGQVEAGGAERLERVLTQRAEPRGVRRIGRPGDVNAHRGDYRSHAEGEAEAVLRSGVPGGCEVTVMSAPWSCGVSTPTFSRTSRNTHVSFTGKSTPVTLGETFCEVKSVSRTGLAKLSRSKAGLSKSSGVIRKVTSTSNLVFKGGAVKGACG
jgi:hypothetical protein